MAHKAKAFDSQFILNIAFFSEMEYRNYVKWAKNYQHAKAAPAFFRLRVLLANAYA
jgi:hypothetical protein